MLKNKNQIKNIINSLLILVFLCIVIWQGYIMLLKYETQFLNPKDYINKNYGYDYISKYGERFNEINKMFPKPTRLSYVGETVSGPHIWLASYLIAQYHFAPNLLLKECNNCDTILYNLITTLHINQEDNFHLKNGWHMVIDFDNGLILLAK